MPRGLLFPTLLLLGAAASCTPKAEPAQEAAPPSILGIWTPNSNGYKSGVYKGPEGIFTSYTDYKSDSTYETVQRHVGSKMSYVYTESGTWSFKDSILTMEPTKKDRKVITGKVEGIPVVTGEIFQIEVVELSSQKMVRKSGGSTVELVKADPPREYTVKDLAPKIKS